jgi:hypothetical protein
MPLGRLSLAAAAAAGGLLFAASCTNPTATGGTGATATGGGTTTSTSSSVVASSTAASVGSGGAGGGVVAPDGGPTYEPSGFACSSKKPSLDTDVVPVTSTNCSTSAGCHLAMQSGPGVYDQLVNRIAEECDDLRMMVTPGDPEGSYVIHKLTGHNLCSPATTMPLEQPMLAAADIQTVYDWICEGAPQK